MQRTLLMLALACFCNCSNPTANVPVKEPDTAAPKKDSLPSPDHTASPKPEPDSDPLAAIRREVTSINTQPLQQKKFQFVCDEKMSVDYFYRDKELVKIVVDFGTVGDVYAREEYYYRQGELLFVYEFVEGGPACEGCITKHEYRSYIRNNRVIRYLKDQIAEPCKKCEFNNTARQYRLLTATTTDQIKNLFCK